MNSVEQRNPFAPAPLQGLHLLWTAPPLLSASVLSPSRLEPLVASLRYLARYVFRVAITESRIVGLDDTGVTIRHKHRASGRWRKTSLHGHEFMRRFLQHVLPRGLHKVRYSGLWHPSRRDAAARARQLLALDRSPIAPPDPPIAEPTGVGKHQSARTASSDAAPRICPCCKRGPLVHVRKLYPMQVRGP